MGPVLDASESSDVDDLTRPRHPVFVLFEWIAGLFV
jgi:hypothetical protein